MLKLGAKLRKAVGSIIAILFIIGAIIIAFTIIEYNVLSQGRLREIQEKQAEAERESIAISKSVTGYWFFEESSSTLLVNITNNYKEPVAVTGIVIYYNDKNYTCLKNNVYSNLQPSDVSIVSFKIVGPGSSRNVNELPQWLSPGETLELKLFIGDREPVSVTYSVSSTGTVAGISASQYIPQVAVAPTVNYRVEYVPEAVPEYTEAGLGYKLAYDAYNDVNVFTVEGTYVSGSDESVKYDDNDYYIVDSAVRDSNWLEEPGVGAWGYRKPIIIVERSGKTLTDFPVKIELNSSNFDFNKAKPDGSDIRFTLDDGITEIPFYIEEWDSVNEKATVWVKIPEIPANGQVKIYMYYYNPNANLPPYATVENVFTLIGEAGTVNTDENIATVYFQGEYDEPPLIFASIMTFNGGDTVVSRVLTRTTDYFTIRLEEYYYDDGPHVVETIGWIALKPGIWVIGDKIWEVGTVTASSTYVTVNLQYSFRDTPATITYINSYNEGGFSGTLNAGAHTRQNNPTSTSFDVKIEEQTDTYHTPETVGYIAILGEKYQRVFWGYWVRIYYTINETVNGLKYEIARLYPETVWYVNNYADGWEPSFWRTYYFHADFSTTPVIVFKIQTENGGDNCHERMRFVSTSRFQYGLQETPAFDGIHRAYEWGGFIAIEPGLIYGYEWVDPRPEYTIGDEEGHYGSRVNLIFSGLKEPVTSFNISFALKYDIVADIGLGFDVYMWNFEEKVWSKVFEGTYYGPDEESYCFTLTYEDLDLREYISNGIVNISVVSGYGASFREYVEYVNVTVTYLRDVVIYVPVMYDNGSVKILLYDIAGGIWNSTATYSTFEAEYAVSCYDKVRGRIWIINNTDSIAYYDVVNEKWESLAASTVNDKFIITPGMSLLFTEKYPEYLFLVAENSAGSWYLWYYDITTSKWFTLKEISEDCGNYSVAVIVGDIVYLIPGDSTVSFYKGNITEFLKGVGSWTRLEDVPTPYSVGFAYGANKLWLLGRGGGLHYFDLNELKWYPYETQIPYMPLSPGNRLVYYQGKLYHVRGDNTRELWIIYVGS